MLKINKLCVSLAIMLGIVSINTCVASQDNDISLKCASTKENQKLNYAVKWYTNSAEKVASYRQTFLIANDYVNKQVKNNKYKQKTWGVVLDIDETVLDNTWYNTYCGNSITSEEEFSKYVVAPKKSTQLPGAKQFTCNVQKLGGYVSLISNRHASTKDKKVLDETIENLKSEGICFDQVILDNDENNTKLNDKNPRFEAVNSGVYDENLMVWSNKLPKHTVIAFVGDNIQDFPKLKQENIVKLDHDDELFTKFGNGYFILPNPTYGSWLKNK